MCVYEKDENTAVKGRGRIIFSVISPVMCVWRGRICSLFDKLFRIEPSSSKSICMQIDAHILGGKTLIPGFNKVIAIYDRA